MNHTGMRRLALVATMLLGSRLGSAAELTREAVSAMLSQLPAGQKVDLAGQRLAGLDLSRLDFTGGDLHGADLSNTNLFAAKFQDANLTGANLSGAEMGITNVIRANLTDANLSGAKMFGLVTSSGMQTSRKEAPIMVRANFSGATVVSRLGFADLAGANFANAHMAADMHNQSMGLMRAEFPSADLTGANFAGADMGHALLRFANLTNAELAGADLSGADMIGANLAGADLADANLAGADLHDARIASAKGLASVKGLDQTGAR